jgi:hypothetical protein
MRAQPESLRPTSGAPFFRAMSITLQIFVRVGFLQVAAGAFFMLPLAAFGPTACFRGAVPGDESLLLRPCHYEFRIPR